jgi:EAL domain-containing protein (putative c-di-GMP-specific phosphodiesterase class I)
MFRADMRKTSTRRYELESGLRRAVDEQQFYLCYQPQIDVVSEEVVAAEALLRWRHPDKGVVAPAEFIPSLERTGLIVPVGEWVLRTACVQAQAWRDARVGDLRMSVNVSARQFRDDDLTRAVRASLDESGLAPDGLVLELTESLLMDGVAERQLRTLEDMGVRIALDDFGTGYSSLAYLRRFPVDTLKIDRSFLHDAASTAADAAIVRGIIALAHALDMEAVAEGVETEEQLALLGAAQCDAVQGFLFARPLEPAALEEWIELYRQSRRRRSA